MDDAEILTAINQERFKRRLSIFRAVSTRIIAILLVLAIIWIGVIQIKYAKEVGDIKNKYGDLGYCYLCGKEALRLCSCQYVPELYLKHIDTEEYKMTLAMNNIQACPTYDMYNRSNENYSSLFNNYTLTIANSS